MQASEFDSLREWNVAARMYGQSMAEGMVAAAAAMVCLLILAAPVARATPSVDRPSQGVVTPDLSASLEQLSEFLDENDVALYRRIREVQERGEWKQADRLVAQLSDDLLLGHVRAQKYLHPTKYRSSYRDLLFWMRSFADHPQARRIYRLALRRQPPDWKSPPRPSSRAWSGSGYDGTAIPRYRSPRTRSGALRREARQLKERMDSRIRSGWPTGAYRILATDRAGEVLDPTEFALARARIAHGYYVFGKDEKALELARRSIRQAARSIPVAAWAGGLAAWRLGRVDEAAKLFPRLAVSEYAPPSERAAGAFWAARAALALEEPREAERWFREAAQAPETFHGLLARRVLGVDESFDWRLPPVTPVLLEQLHAVPGARRGLALLRVGDHAMAEAEFRRVVHAVSTPLKRTAMTIAARHGMARLAMELAHHLHAAGDRWYFAALFPDPPWALPQGTGVDRSLVQAIMRLESRFDPRARSPRGARGLMQLMPRTASYINRLRGPAPGERVRASALYDPELNIEIAIRYIRYLLDQHTANGNLFQLLTAYNAGPGNLRKWKREVEYRDDPLLFIESVPLRDTRQYVEDVLHNLWMYRLKRGEPTPGLDRLAAGHWPQYHPVENRPAREVAHAGN